MSTNISGHILSGVGASSIGKFWVIAAQLILIPVLSSNWGAHEYGLWLMCSTIPAYALLTNFGIGAAATTAMTLSVSRGDITSALQVYQTGWTATNAASAFLAALAALIYFINHSLITIAPSTPHNIPMVLLAFTAYSIASLNMNYISGSLFATRRYALGTIVFDITYPIETAAVAAVAIYGGGLLEAATAMALVRISALIIYYIFSRIASPMLSLGYIHFSFETMRRLIRPAVASLTLTASAAIALQGTLLIVGIVYSPAAAAIFGAVRLITRAPLQVSGIVVRATQPEMTRSLAAEDTTLTTTLHAIVILFTLLVMVPSIAMIIAVGSWLLELITDGTLSAPRMLYVALGSVAVLNATWNALSLRLLAQNLQSTFSSAYFICASILLILILPAKGLGAGIVVTSFLWAALEAIMCVWVAIALHKRGGASVLELLTSARRIMANPTKAIRILVNRMP